LYAICHSSFLVGIVVRPQPQPDYTEGQNGFQFEKQRVFHINRKRKHWQEPFFRQIADHTAAVADK
jgi:hypothetical protein